MESITNWREKFILIRFLVIPTIIFTSSVICGIQSSSTTSLPPILPTPLIIPSSTLPITSGTPSQLSLSHDKSYFIPVRLRLPKDNSTAKPIASSTESVTSDVHLRETKAHLYRWFPFNRLFRRHGRQTSVQIAVTLTLGVTAALSAIILALLIALLISIGSLGYAVKKCSFGFGKYLYKLFGSVDQHSHKFLHILHLIIRILNEVSGRQNHQTDFLFHLIHIIREVGIERQNQRLIAAHEIDVNEHGPPHPNGPPRHDLSSYPGFSKSPRGFHEQQSIHHSFEQGPPPKGFELPRNFGHPNRDTDTPLSYMNKTSDYEYPHSQSNFNGQPNLQYQNPYYTSFDSSRQDSSSMYDDQHPNHKYD